MAYNSRSEHAGSPSAVLLQRGEAEINLVTINGIVFNDT